ncbi:MAG TPA: hypothetical protein VEZ11_00495 [Thermoanaerobaculia bacterium]|nr:hypothetical protein [Thermoanaerobaculia bacterium]
MPEHAHFDDDAIVNPETHHERSDVNLRALVLSAGVLIALFAVSGVGVWYLFRFFRVLERGNVKEPMTSIARPAGMNVPVEPRLQPFPARSAAGDIPPYRNTPVTDMEEMHRIETEKLTSYGWNDRAAGTVRIPIDDAKRISLQRGFPVVGGTKP